MRFHELIIEDYTDSLMSEIINLLAAMSAEGVTEIDTTALLLDLQSQGHTLDTQTLLQLIDQIEIVTNANADTVSLANDADMNVGADANEIGQDRVDSLATKKSTDDIGDEL